MRTPELATLKHCIFILALVCSLLSSAQNPQLKISGRVEDTTQSAGIKNALIMAVKLADSSLVAYTKTSADGSFLLDKLPLDTFEILVQYPGLNDQTYIVFGDPNNTNINLGRVVLPTKSQGLNEVVIYGYKDPVYFKGDTLVFTADSFKVAQNANVEQLLKKLPGIQVDKEGKIKSQGKDVSQVLVDGDEFFGSDPTMATRNLYAENIESVEVYDKKNENAGMSPDEKETITIMDLKLKEDAKKGYFGRVEGGGDFQNFYQAQILANKFKGTQKMSVFALGSNTPKTALGWQDSYKFGINDGSYELIEGEEGMVIRSNEQSPQGFPTTRKLGFFFSDKIKGKNKLTINYGFREGSLRITDSTYTQYFLADTSYATRNTEFENQKNRNNQLSINYQFQPDSMTTIELAPSLGNVDNRTSRNIKNDFLSQDQILTRSTYTFSGVTVRGEDLGLKTNISRNMLKKGRKIVLNNQIQYSSRNSPSSLLSVFLREAGPFADSTVDQRKSAQTSDLLYKGKLAFIEPLGLKWKINSSYELLSGLGSQEKLSFNNTNTGYDLLDSSFSNAFENKRNIHTLTGGLEYESKKNRFTFGLAVRKNEIRNLNKFNGQRINQDVLNLLPFASARRKFSDSKQITFSYTTQSTVPSLQQLQPLPDNLNPNFIRVGNPDLSPSLSHNFNLNYYSFSAIKNRHFYTGLNATFVDNAISSSTSIDNIGRNYSQTINVSNNAFYTAYFGGMTKIFGPLNLDVYQIFQSSSYSSRVNGFDNLTQSVSSESTAEIELNLDKFVFSAGAGLTQSSTTSSLNSNSNQNFGSNFFEFDLEWKLPADLSINSNLRSTQNSQRTQGFNVNYTIWSASIEKAFLSKKNLLLSIDATDILNQNIALTRNIQGNLIIDSKKSIIGRYILLNLVYRFDSNKEKLNEDDDFF